MKTLREIGVKTLRAEVERLGKMGIHPNALACFAEAEGLKADAEETRREADPDDDDWTARNELESQRESMMENPREFVADHFEDIGEALTLIEEEVLTRGSRSTTAR